MVKENNCDDGDVKLFPKIIGTASLLKNEPSTSHRSENWPSPRSRWKTRRIFTFATILISVLIFFVLGTYHVKLWGDLFKLGGDLFILGTDLVKLGRVEQTRSNVVTVGHSQIWTSLTQLRPNWYLDRRPLASHYKNNPSQISPSSVLLEWWSPSHSCLNNNGWGFHRTPQIRENYDCCAITMIVSVHITRRGHLNKASN